MTATDTNVPIHPAANLFPQMDAKAYREFVDDIKQFGLRDPIARLPDGTLIDGRHRLRACRELGIDPEFVTVNPASPTAYVVSKNKHRRHLSKSQIAMIVARAMPHYRAEAKERQRESTHKAGVASGAARRARTRGEEVPHTLAEPKKHIPYAPDRAIERAAKDGGVNAKYVQRAIGILKHPDVAEKVDSGELSIDAACAEVSKRTGKRATILANKAVERAGEFVGRIEGVPGYCKKVNADVIRGNERLHRQWLRALTEAIAAVRDLKRQLEDR